MRISGFFWQRDRQKLAEQKNNKKIKAQKYLQTEKVLIHKPLLVASWGKWNAIFGKYFSTNLCGNLTVRIRGPLLRGAAAFEPVPPQSSCALLPIDSHIWMLSGGTGRRSCNKYQALSKLTPEADAGPFPTLCLRNVPLTCWVRGLYGELLSRSARMLVRESISASKLDRLSSIVLPPGFTWKKKEKFLLFKPLGLAHEFLLSSRSCTHAQQ